MGSLGNPDIFGSAIALVPNLTININRNNPWSLQATLGVGFSYFTMPYDPVTNKENLLVGSHITNLTYATILIRRRLDKQLFMKTGISYFHGSNGHYQLPNVGINIPSVSMGLIYHTYDRSPYYHIPNNVNLDKNLKFNLRLGIGVQEFGAATGPVGQKKYPVYITSLYLSKRYGKLGCVHLGLNTTYYQRFYEYYIDNSRFEGYEIEKSMVLTGFLAHEFYAGHFGFIGQGGINFYAPQHGLSFKLGDRWITLDSFLESYVSTKLGVQYYVFSTDNRISKNLSIGLFLKANFGQADFVETNIGYCF